MLVGKHSSSFKLQYIISHLNRLNSNQAINTQYSSIPNGFMHFAIIYALLWFNSLLYLHGGTAI